MERFKPLIVWKDGIMYDCTGVYEISNYGTIKSLGRADKRGNMRKEKIMSPYTNHSGYNVIQLTCGDYRGAFSVHRIVWESFNGRIPDGMQINHIDECKTRNNLDNLELVTAKENMNWGTRNERSRKKISEARTGKRYPKAGKPVLQYDLNGVFLKRYDCASYAEDDLHIPNCQGNISACCRGKLKTAYGYKWKFEI